MYLLTNIVVVFIAGQSRSPSSRGLG
ncbi:DUF4408 domain-containing protein [Martelella alba]|uniref:DUF4408 domain-containing protein n=1 Tax=Martelella alba TaxID=2590451 RepID=A0ABY2SDJ4_9HYPH|nr:DUF4408 domain-containing protein [Martelella alba]